MKIACDFTLAIFQRSRYMSLLRLLTHCSMVIIIPFERYVNTYFEQSVNDVSAHNKRPITFKSYRSFEYLKFCNASVKTMNYVSEIPNLFSTSSIDNQPFSSPEAMPLFNSGSNLSEIMSSR